MARNSVAAALVVVVVILIIGATVYNTVNYLHGKVHPTEATPANDCISWLEARRRMYLGASGLKTPLLSNTETGRPYTPCEAASRAVADSQTQGAGVCPKALPVGPAADRQYPYIAYLAARRCPIA